MLSIELPWTEKYRPKNLSEVVGHEAINKRLKAYVQKENLPNLLFAGNAGIGKTASAIALAKEMYGDEYKQNFLELNSSDERGIDIIRGKIKDFAATLPYGKAKFKIIFLDEADALTRDAQNALRRTMENYAHTSRFILSCNYSNRIIEPIQSRCALFRYRPLPEDIIITRLKEIAKLEKLDIEDAAFKAFMYASSGDMRKSINYLQTASTIEGKITEEDVFKIAARARPTEIKELIDTALGGDFETARKRLDALMFDYGMSGTDVLLQIYREIINSDLDGKVKVELVDRIGEYDFRLTEGANERIQLESLIAHLVLKGKK